MSETDILNGYYSNAKLYTQLTKQMHLASDSKLVFCLDSKQNNSLFGVRNSAYVEYRSLLREDESMRQ